jgi:phenylpropionate dioxygenase-like ring-hydroxylating dioxygenase large terminal subunit
MNFWYAVEFSQDVTTQPKALRVLGQDLVAFRPTLGAPAVIMSDLCVHRGGALSGGRVKDGCIECPYHGWRYGPDGACRLIPSVEPGTTIPKRARIDSYPTVERSGFVWAFLGDLPENERPPIPTLPHMEDPRFRAVSGQTPLWNVNYERALENNVDFGHPAFVHVGTFGNPNQTVIPPFEVVEREWSIATTIQMAESSGGTWDRLSKRTPDGDVVEGKAPTQVELFMPNVIETIVDFGRGKYILYDSFIPVDEATTLIKWVVLRTAFKNPVGDVFARRMQQKVFEQDRVVLERVRPELLPFDLRAELHTKADALGLAYRRMRDRCIEKGWGIDRHQLPVHGPRREATVIPSPARREVPELARAWVLKEAAVQQAPARN